MSGRIGPSRRVILAYCSNFLGAVSRIDAMKRSACIEGARMALARVKAYWTDMEATIIASQDPAEHYLEQVIEGARLIEAQCSKNVMFE